MKNRPAVDAPENVARRCSQDRIDGGKVDMHVATQLQYTQLFPSS